MPMFRRIEVDYDKVWYIGSWTVDDDSRAQVIIPVEQIQGFSDREIGSIVRSLVGQAIALHNEEVLGNLQRDATSREPSTGKRKPFDRAAAFVALGKANGFKCAYCKSTQPDTLVVDHIIPVAAGGTNERTNLQLLCDDCNRKKGAHIV